MRLTCVASSLTVLIVCLGKAQTLPLPLRFTNSVSGDQFVDRIGSLPLADRETEILGEILSGNVPDFLRPLCPVNITSVIEGRTNSATFFVTSDYLAVGADENYFLTPMTPMTAQIIADRLDCTLPTRKMVNAIYATAAVKLVPEPIPPSATMTSVPVFQQHHDIVRTQRVATFGNYPPGKLVAGHKKDIVITPRLMTNVNKVAIYGWHQTNGQPIQPLYLGHTTAWVDYSHGVRLVQQRMILNGEATTVSRVLVDPKLASLLSDEGLLADARYSTNSLAALSADKIGARTNLIEFKPSRHFGERIAEFTFNPEVRVRINAPPAEDFAPDKPVQLIFYALPNGNTIEQTVGKKLQPGNDWHFDIQHIGAQTRFLRNLLTNQTIIIAYLEAEMKSWPAWRRKHGDAAIPNLIDSIKRQFPTNRLEIVLTGHSGGGSFTFGYLNTQKKIPDEVRRIAFLDSNYAYETTNHFSKLADWLKSSSQDTLCVLAYHDSIALLDGKTFVSERGGTWGRSHAMLADFKDTFPFASSTNAGLQTHTDFNNRVHFFLKENPEKKILHTVQVERNGFIHAVLVGTPFERKGYEYLGDRAYSMWIQSE